MPSIFEEITIFAKNFEKRIYSPRDVTYIFIKTVYFPINQNGMAKKKKSGGRILMRNESLETCVYITSVRRCLQEHERYLHE